MQFRGLLIATLLLALLAGGVWWSNRVEKEKEGKPGSDAAPLILDLEEEQLTRIEVKMADKPPLVLSRSAEGQWEMTEPEPLPVDQSAVQTLVSSVASLSSDRVVEEKVENLSSYGLDNPQLTVSVATKGNQTKTVLVGSQTPTGSYHYAKLAGDPRLFTLPNFGKTSLEKSPEDVRDKRLLRVDTSKIASVEVTSKGKTIAFGKNDEKQWQIIRPASYRTESFQVDELVRKASEARMETPAEGETARARESAFRSGAPVAKVVVTDDKGTHELEVRKKGEEYFARSSMTEGVWKVANFSVEGLDKGLEEYRNKKLFDFGFSEPSRITVKTKDKTYTFAKEGDKWMSDGKQMDGPLVQAVIDQLRDLTATGFSSKSFPADASIEASVVYNEGKKTEKVLLAQSGSEWLAKREGEPAVAVIEAATPEQIVSTAQAVTPYQAPKNEGQKQ